MRKGRNNLLNVPPSQTNVCSHVPSYTHFLLGVKVSGAVWKVDCELDRYAEHYVLNNLILHSIWLSVIV